MKFVDLCWYEDVVQPRMIDQVAGASSLIDVVFELLQARSISMTSLRKVIFVRGR